MLDRNGFAVRIGYVQHRERRMAELVDRGALGVPKRSADIALPKW